MSDRGRGRKEQYRQTHACTVEQGLERNVLEIRRQTGPDSPS